MCLFFVRKGRLRYVKAPKCPHCFPYFSDFTIYQIFVNINIHISLPLTAVFFDYGCFYKMSGGMSRDSMLKALEKEVFTHEQAVHAADVLKR